MYRILELLIEDFGNRKPSAEYQLLQQKLSEIEKPFINSLSEEQKKAFFELDSIGSKLHSKNLDDLAEFLFEDLKRFI